MSTDRAPVRRQVLRGNSRGSSAFEVMFALVLLATAILGVAAAQAAAWRVVAGSKVDGGTWTALHAQAERLLASGHDQIATGTGVVGGYPMQWTVTGSNPKVVVLSTHRTFMTHQVADTVRLVVVPDP